MLALSDAPEFEDVIRAAAAHHGILPDLIRKDYWVTRVLRAVATDATQSGRVLFKGGTSLSKGWRLIDRFSEDIDLLLTGPAFGSMPEGRKQRERQFKELRARIEDETPLRLPERTSLTREEWDFLYLRDDLHCNIRYPLPDRTAHSAGSSVWLLVEMGYRGGVHPHAPRPITSLVAEFIDTQPAARAVLIPYAADLMPFQMELLKPERTLTEKLLLLHTQMSAGVEGARRVRTRHYYDITRLAERSEDVRMSLERGELHELLRDAARVSNAYFGTAIDVDALDLSESSALAPTPDQVRVLRASFERPLERDLYYRDPLSFDEILERLPPLRETLARRREPGA
jgi:predicted nucleotidyltransferase component of viral defense system